MQTWTKTLLGIVIILAVLGAAWYSRHTAVPVAAPTISTSTPSGGATTTPAVATYRSDRGGFTFQYDASYTMREDTSGPYSGWPFLTQQAGTKSVTISISTTTQPQTNFAGAEFRVAYSSSSNALAKCATVDPNQNFPSAVSQEVVNGIRFTSYKTSDAGAGNFYNTTSFRTLHAGACYAVDLMIHSTNIANYPPERQIQQFDAAKAESALRAILQTFKFL
jgi:hypothetical protein